MPYLFPGGISSRGTDISSETRSRPLEVVPIPAPSARSLRFFGHTYRNRPLDDVRREIESLGKSKFIVFLDDNIVGNPKFAKELFRALIPYNIKWVAQASVTVAKEEELLKLAADGGCLSLFIGFESISPTCLAAGLDISQHGERAYGGPLR